MHKDYAVGIYFFRDEGKHDLQLKTLKQRGLILVKTAHPGYEPFSNEEFLSSPDRVRGWAREAEYGMPRMLWWECWTIRDIGLNETPTGDDNETRVAMRVQ